MTTEGCSEGRPSTSNQEIGSFGSPGEERGKTKSYSTFNTVYCSIHVYFKNNEKRRSVSDLVNSFIIAF